MSATEIIDALVCDVTITGEPRPKGRPRVVASGTYTPERSAEWEGYVRQMLALEVRLPEGRYAIDIELWFITETRQRKDLDNLVKLVLDAANTVVWDDDFQVEALKAHVERGAGRGRGATRVLVKRGQRLVGWCGTCGTDLTVKQTSFCSKACYDAAQFRGQPRVCRGCGNTFATSPSRNAAGYCSMECWRRAASGAASCRRCGAEFACTPSQPRRWCSDDCRDADLRAKPLTSKIRGACTKCGGPTTSTASNALCRACFLGQGGL